MVLKQKSEQKTTYNKVFYPLLSYLMLRAFLSSLYFSISSFSRYVKRPFLWPTSLISPLRLWLSCGLAFKCSVKWLILSVNFGWTCILVVSSEGFDNLLFFCFFHFSTPFNKLHKTKKVANYRSNTSPLVLGYPYITTFSKRSQLFLSDLTKIVLLFAIKLIF